MPYVRYRGGRPPKNPTQLKKVAGRDAPCCVGFDTVVAQTWREVEALGLGRAAMASEFERRIEQATYDGLNHVGGVCFVETSSLRACDEAISEDEYLAACSAIDAQNADAQTARSAAIERANDLGRRALAQHEAMAWRTRVLIKSYARLVHHEPYTVGRLGFAYMRSQVEECQDGSIIHVIDIYHEGDVPIEDAVLLGREAAELLADLLSVVAFGPSVVLRVIGTSPTTCREGIAFQVACFSGFAWNSAVEVRPAMLDSSVTIVDRTALHHVREGLSRQMPTDAFAALWNAVEVLAHEHAQSEGLQRVGTCERCGFERNIGWNTKLGFERLYAAAGFQSSSFDEHRRTRGRIQHGAAAGDIDSQRAIAGECGSLRAAAIVGVTQRFGLVPQASTLLSPDVWPVRVWTCIVVGNEVTASMQSQHVRFESTGLPHRLCGDAGRNVYAGMAQVEQPDSGVFPPLAVS